MNKPLPGTSSVNRVQVDVETIIRKLNALGVHVYCPKSSDQGKTVELEVSIFDGLKINHSKN